MNLLRPWRLRGLSKPKLDTVPHEDEPAIVAPDPKADTLWSQKLIISQDQESAVRSYVAELKRQNQQICISLGMLGKSGVGKKCIRFRWSFGAFLDDTFDPTDNHMFKLYSELDGTKIVYEGFEGSPNVEWTALDFDSRDILSSYFNMRHCEACAFVFDPRDAASFDAVRHYYENFLLERSLERADCYQHCSPCVPRPSFKGLVFVIANKIEEDAAWAVTRQEAEDFCASIEATFVPMSAKTGEGGGVELLKALSRLILLRRLHHISTAESAQVIDGGTRLASTNLQHRNEDFLY